MLNELPHNNKGQTWTRRTIVIILVVALIYGLWFDFLDSLAFCFDNAEGTQTCVSIGKMFGENLGKNFGGNKGYQSWNIMGHIIPGLFVVLFYIGTKHWKSAFELSIVGFLISTSIMDSPVWGAIRLYVHQIPLWHQVQDHQEATSNITEWIISYYNPIGTYLVWDQHWIFDNFPTSATIFWSLIGRLVAAAIIIYWQFRNQEKHKV
jgi:hypothetical protein